jgi:HEAT repeat protein
MDELARNKAHSIEQLIEDLKQHDWSVNRGAAGALAEMGQNAFPHLLKALESVDGFVRNGAAIALGEIGNIDATQPLLRALQWRDDRVYEDDEDHEARISAARALGKLRDPNACAPLMTELEKISNTNWTLVSYIVEALGEIGNQQAIYVIARMVEHGDFETQKVASWALAKMGKEGVEILLKMAPDRAQLGRQFVVRALGASRSESAVPVLIDILKNRKDEKLVRGEAARTLGRLGKSAEVMPVLLDILGTCEDEVRSSALLGLGSLRDPAAYETIIKQLEDIDLRYTAVMALGELGCARACEILISMLKSEDYSLRYHAVTALGKIGCSNAIPALKELLDRITDSPLSAVEEVAIEATIKMLQSK